MNVLDHLSRSGHKPLVLLVGSHSHCLLKDGRFLGSTVRDFFFPEKNVVGQMSLENTAQVLLVHDVDL